MPTSSTRTQDFLSTVRTTAARPGQVLNVVVLTSDKSLLEVLRSAAGSEHALWEAVSADGAVDYLVGGRCDVLIADLGSLRGDVAALLSRLQAQFPELIVMATGRREEEGLIASLLSNGRIYRFLHKPISPARASQFLNAATRRYNDTRAFEPVALATVRTFARKQPKLSKAVVAGAGGVLAAVLAFAVWHSREQGLPATLQTSHVGDSSVEDQVKSKLGSAQIALLSGRLIDPRGDNALEYYKAVLAMEPKNADAQAGVQKVIDTLEARVVKALQDRNAPRVVTAWTALQRAAPNHPKLDAMRAQLLALSRTSPNPSAVANNARPRNSAAPAAVSNAPANAPAANVSSPPAARTVAEQVAERELAEAIARELAEQEAASRVADASASALAANGTSVPASTSESISEPEVIASAGPSPEEVAAVADLRERGALISPAGNNAFDAMVALRNRYPDAEPVRSEQQRLASVLMDRARTALAAKDLNNATAFIDRASTLIPGTTAVRVLKEQLATAEWERDFDKNVVLATTIKRLREVPAVYPRDAARDGTEGWVQVEFTITPDGSTRDLRVKDSAPRTVFDRAAMDSVSKWRFEPVLRDGTPVAQRAWLQVRFKLD